MLNKLIDTQINFAETGIKTALKYIPHEETRNGLDTYYTASFDYVRSMIDSTENYTRNVLTVFQTVQ
jgi:hypothetical protein